MVRMPDRLARSPVLAVFLLLAEVVACLYSLFTPVVDRTSGVWLVGLTCVHGARAAGQVARIARVSVLKDDSPSRFVRHQRLPFCVPKWPQEEDKSY